MLVYELLAKGMEDFIFIPSDIDDAVEMFEIPEEQQTDALRHGTLRRCGMG